MMNHLNLKAPSLNSLLESDRGSNDSLLADSLQLDIEELDDVEYSIPSVDNLPTLESVLNDLDSEFEDIPDAAAINGIVAPTPTPSMSDGVADNLKQTSILRHVVLQGVTAQIKSASERVNAGHASALAINHKIAVGTSHGHILCFDFTQTLKWCCQDFVTQGAVSAMSFNDDSTRLLAGFARGHIIMIDTQKGDVIRSLTDVITPNAGVLHIKWTEKAALALCSDSGGSVWNLNFTRRLGIRGCTSRCLFSGARGEVCAVEPLLLGEDGIDHPLRAYTIVALATLSKFFVVMIRPRLKVIKYQVMTGPGECLPLLAWQMVLIQAADTTRMIDPVLAAGRGNQLFFFQMCYNQGRMNFLFLRKVELSYHLMSLHWVGPKSIACLDTSENLHLSEVRSNQEHECIDMNCVSLVYNSAQFKGLATGGNVSPAMALAGSAACYNTVISIGHQLYLLGAKSLHAVSVRAWGDRITHLSNQHRWGEAIEISINHYRSLSERPKRHEQAKEKIVMLINDYLAKTGHCPELCLGPVIACLIEIREFEMLWAELWDRLPSKTMYLNLLTDHIENDDLDLISPVVAQYLIDYWQNTSLSRLDGVILKLRWECLDLHQVLTISKRDNLYRSFIHLNTKALSDYTTPLVELVPHVLVKGPSLGNILLVYVSSCLAGRGYPTGDIPDEKIPSVKHEILRCLTVSHSNLASDSELAYPYLRTLLKFNTRETLNVLSLAFQEAEFNGELGQSYRQRIINILLEIMTPDESTWSEIGCLLNFVSQQISLKNLPNDDALLRRIVSYISMESIDGETTREHSEREQAWLELLTSSFIGFISNEEMIQLAQKSKCYLVLEYLLEKICCYGEILECYIHDSRRHYELFTYLRKHIKNPERNIKPQIIKHFLRLFDINPNEMVQIIIEHYPKDIQDFILLLDADQFNLFVFLDKIIKTNLVEFDVTDTYLNLQCQYNPEQVEHFLRTNESYKVEAALEIVTKYNLHSACIYLHEKTGNYQTAFEISIQHLDETTTDIDEATSKQFILETAALCSRAAMSLTHRETEKLWFTLIETILKHAHLASITKNILHQASHYVDLQKLVQLVLNAGANNFGDIKHLIVGMLSNSRYENILLHTTSKILGHDLHAKLAHARKQSNAGISVKSIKCIVCRMKLHQPQCSWNVTIYTPCGHAVHEKCINDQLECPRCGASVSDGVLTLPQPSLNVLRMNEMVDLQGSDVLNVAAPPRVGIARRQ